MDRFVRVSGWLNIVGAILLIVSWLSLGVLNSASIAGGNYEALFIGPANIVILIALFSSMLVLTSGFPGLFLYLKDFRVSAIIGFFCFLTGFVWFTSIQYYETFVLPYFAVHDLTAFELVLKGKDKLVFAGFLTSALPWTLGIILFGIALLRCKSLKRPVSALWIIGGVLQLFGAIPVRTVGFIFISFAIFYFGVKMRARA